MKLKKGSAAAKAYMAKIRAKRGTKKVGAKKLTAKKVGSIKNNIIEFSDGYKFKKVTKDYAAKNFNKIEVFGIDLSNESEGLIESKNDLNSFDTFGIEFKTTKKIGSTLKLNPKEKRLGAVNKDLKTRAKSYHKDTKSHNVNIRVVSGIGTVTQKLEKSLEWINFYTDQLNWWKNYKPKNIYERKGKTDSIKFYTKSLSNEKKHLASIKKTI
jgi:hypothetical protein